jgi:ElaB/YqjD/DUF883 family membrane-anchored ribosome-binding protein
MAETLPRSSDTPNFDTYPANPPDSGSLAPEQNKTALEQRASQVGAAMGKVVVMLRKSQDRLKDIAGEKGEEASTRLNDLTETAKGKAQDAATQVQELADAAKAKTQEWGYTASLRAVELRQMAAEKAFELRSRARVNYYRARLRANQISREYPVQVVLTAGAVGLLLGVGMRIWRANREY